MRWPVFVLSVLVLSFPSDGWTKGKKRKLPPLPEPTELSLEFTAESDEEKVFAEAATAAAEIQVTGPTEPKLTWTLGDWRRQMRLDVERMADLQKAMAERLAQAYKEDFTVAIRYLRGVYQSVEQLTQLGRDTYRRFDEEIPQERNGELSPNPPERARRIRLYLSKIEGLDGRATSFLERAVEGRTEEIVRIDDDAE